MSKYAVWEKLSKDRIAHLSGEVASQSETLGIAEEARNIIEELLLRAFTKLHEAFPKERELNILVFRDSSQEGTCYIAIDAGTFMSAGLPLVLCKKWSFNPKLPRQDVWREVKLQAPEYHIFFKERYFGGQEDICMYRYQMTLREEESIS